MKRIIPFLGLFAFFCLGLISCQKTSFSDSDLVGRWQEVNTKGHYMVFTAETDDNFTDSSYKYGYEWTEPEYYESDITKFGNGSFEWKLNGKELMFMELFEINDGGFPKVYTVTTLDGDNFSYTNGNRTYTFKKVH